jgi:hypothetical protein
MAPDELVCKLAGYVYCDRETTVLRQRDSRCCSASLRFYGASLLPCDLQGQMKKRFLRLARNRIVRQFKAGAAHGANVNAQTGA